MSGAAQARAGGATGPASGAAASDGPAQAGAAVRHAAAAQAGTPARSETAAAGRAPRAVAAQVALALTAALSVGSAAAQTPAPGPIYAAFDRGVEGRGGVTFVFSDAATPDVFAPKAAYAVRPTAQGCGWDFAADPDIAPEFRLAPVVNPLDPAAPFNPIALPQAMADLTVAELQRLGLVSGKTALAAHQTCVRRLWERIVGLRR